MAMIENIIDRHHLSGRRSSMANRRMRRVVAPLPYYPAAMHPTPIVTIDNRCINAYVTS